MGLPPPARVAWAVTLVALLVGGGLGLYALSSPPGPHGGAPGVVQVVAAENFWGSLVSQLGGLHAQVHTILADPNADPHSYESTTADAIAVADAQFVIETGAGYDAWCQHLVTASATPGQVVLSVAGLVGKQPGDNPHVWYGASYVRAAVAAMYGDLASIDPADRAYFAISTPR